MLLNVPGSGQGGCPAGVIVRCSWIWLREDKRISTHLLYVLLGLCQGLLSALVRLVARERAVVCALTYSE